ncbi:MAG: amino acid-binding protein [Methanohalobium sp.]|uniref:amino acid-binding protein n=1 Tax=Methanohalobium sp. TaxID=2837493 RepID=UPI00397871C1
MRISMDIELQDRPGQLLQALQPISDLKGNLISVVHHHEKEKHRRSKIPVQCVIDIDPEKLDELKSRLKERGIGVAKVGEQRFVERGAVVLIGHVVHNDIQDTIDTIDRTGYAEVVDLTLSMPKIDQTSSAFLKIDAVGKKELNDSISLLKEVAKEKDLLVVEPIETKFT